MFPGCVTPVSCTLLCAFSCSELFAIDLLQNGAIDIMRLRCELYSVCRQDTGKPKMELVDQFEEDVKENMNAHNVAAFVTAYTK